MLCLMHPRMGVALCAARTCCWLTLSLLPTSTPRSLSAGLLSSLSSHHLYLCLALLHPRCSIRHFNLLNFVPINHSPVLQSIGILLQGLSSLQRVNSTFHLSIISKLANGAFNSTEQQSLEQLRSSAASVELVQLNDRNLLFK